MMESPESHRRVVHTLPRVGVHRGEGMPPGYDEVISSTRYPILRASISDTDIGGVLETRPARQWKLKFVDFTPHLAGTNSRRNMSSFGKLLDRANAWLQNNKNVAVATCETVTWCAEDLRKLNDTDVITCTIKRGNIKRLHFMRGVRLWVTPRQESSDESINIAVREFTPDTLDHKALENFDLKTLIRQTNNKMWESPIAGDIINIETVLQPTRADTSREKLSLKTQDTYWTDGAKINRKYIPIIRVYYALGARNLNVEIGITDMVPRVMKQQGRNRYEDMESLMIRASEWIQNQPHVNVTNLQTMMFRRRGFVQGVGLPVFWPSPDSEDACIRCLRIAYTKPKTMVTLRVLRAQRFCVRKKTFAPKRSVLSTAHGSGRNNQPDDLKYQSFTKTVEEVSQWIDNTAVDVLCVETLRHQVHEGKYHSLPDSSLVKPSDDKSREFITLTRIFLKANNNSALTLTGPSSLFNNPMDRPFWSRPHPGSLVRRTRSRRWRHVLLVMIILIAILTVAVIIALVLAVGRGWL